MALTDSNKTTPKVQRLIPVLFDVSVLQGGTCRCNWSIVYDLTHRVDIERRSKWVHCGYYALHVAMAGLRMPLATAAASARLGRPSSG